MNIKQQLDGVMKFLALWSAGLAMINLAGLVILFVLILSLRLFGISIPSADEFGSIMLAGLFTFGLAAAVADDSHLDVRFVVTTMPQGLQRILLFFSVALSVFVVGLLLQGMSAMWFSAFTRGSMMLGSLPIPKALPIGVVASGVLLFEIALVLKLFDLILSGIETSGRRAKE